MAEFSISMKAGTRGSVLALRQTGDALERIGRLVPGLAFEIVAVSTPGDRDRQLDLRESPEDFFTRDLDDMLLAGNIDCAVHSAKDLPERLATGIDWFWLPWSEDPRDVVVLPHGTHALPPEPFRIGVSSSRREAYCRQHFPQAEMLSVRGNIQERLAQLDAGDYDMLIMAAAALHRLDLTGRIHSYISLDEMVVPAGQGRLALTFREGDPQLLALRNLLIPPVQLAGAGIGDAGNVSQAVVKAVRNCEVCLHDALLPGELLELLPPGALQIGVGKRQGRHSAGQEQIGQLMLLHARRGLRVLRLKGGDPTVFGRLAEETDLLQAASLPFAVLPGIGTLSVAAASTGILPSRRDTARGFAVMTPRRAGSAEFSPVLPEERLRLPQIYYMAATVLHELSAQYLHEGFPASTPVAVVFAAGSAEEQVIDGTLANIAGRVDELDSDEPALVVIGEPAASGYRFHKHAPLAGRRVLYCGSTAGSAKARDGIGYYGGHCVNRPMLRLEPTPAAREVMTRLERYDYLLVTSPSCAQLLFELLTEMRLDLRRLPSLMVCGPGTAQIYRAHGIYPEIAPENDFGARGLIKTLAAVELAGRSVLRLCSDLAGGELREFLEQSGALVEEVVFYRNLPVAYDQLPQADMIIFTSKSVVKAFLENFGPDTLQEKILCVIGAPTYEFLAELDDDFTVVQAVDATIHGCAMTLAGYATAAKIAADGPSAG